MSNEKLIEMINLYFDNELSKQEEVLLFTSLAGDEEMRELFKNYNLLHSAVEQSKEEYPSALDEKILSKVLTEEAAKIKAPKVKINNFIFYAMSIVILLASIIFYTTFEKTRAEMEYTQRQIILQSKMIDELLNSIPTVTVKSKMDNEVIIQSKI